MIGGETTSFGGDRASGVRSPHELRREFDLLADAWRGGWDPNASYHRFLLRALSGSCAHALDLGCGTGTFARLLARRAERVLAVDLSPRMIEVARERSAEPANIDWRVVDVTRWAWPTEHFDCVAALATLHHLPLEPTLERMRDALRPGGTLLVLDLLQSDTAGDRLLGPLAAVTAFAWRALRHGRLRADPEESRLWKAHGRHDVYPTRSEVRDVAARVLPGARLRRHLLWRYSLVWNKPGAPTPAQDLVTRNRRAAPSAGPS